MRGSRAPAWDQSSTILAWLIAAIRMKSWALVKKEAKVDATGFRPTDCMPTAVPSIVCSAMNISRNWSGGGPVRLDLRVEFDTSPSHTRTVGSVVTIAARVSPKAPPGGRILLEVRRSGVTGLLLADSDLGGICTLIC